MNGYDNLVNKILNAAKEKRSKQEYYNKRFQAPFCCGHRMEDNRNDGTEFWCPHCGKLQKRKVKENE